MLAETGDRRIVKASITEQLAGRAVERTVAGRRAEYEAEMRRIVETTFSLIQRTGSLDPSIRDILAESGISTQAFYRYFASKDELMLVLLDEGRRRLMDTLERRMRRARPPPTGCGPGSRACSPRRPTRRPRPAPARGS